MYRASLFFALTLMLLVACSGQNEQYLGQMAALNTSLQLCEYKLQVANETISKVELAAKSPAVPQATQEAISQALDQCQTSTEVLSSSLGECQTALSTYQDKYAAAQKLVNQTSADIAKYNQLYDQKTKELLDTQTQLGDMTRQRDFERLQKEKYMDLYEASQR